MAINSVQDFLDLVNKAVARDPANLSIDLRGNMLTDAGAQYIADALTQTRIPEGLTLKFDTNVQKTLEKILVKKVEQVIADMTVTEGADSQAVNAIIALERLFPNVKHWNEHPFEDFYAQYFQLELSKIHKKDFSKEDTLKTLEDLFKEFHERAQELNFPKSYRWQSLFEAFSKTFSELPAQSKGQETAHQGQLFRFKKAEMLQELKLKGTENKRSDPSK